MRRRTAAPIFSASFNCRPRPANATMISARHCTPSLRRCRSRRGVCSQSSSMVRMFQPPLGVAPGGTKQLNARTLNPREPTPWARHVCRARISSSCSRLGNSRTILSPFQFAPAQAAGCLFYVKERFSERRPMVASASSSLGLLYTWLCLIGLPTESRLRLWQQSRESRTGFRLFRPMGARPGR